MNAGIAASISGINAASTKLATSANNIANSDSTKKLENGVQKNEVFVPSTTTDVSTGGSAGGVKSFVNPVEPATFLKTYDPSSPDADADGSITRPNVDLGQETVTQIQAKTAYKANIATLEAQNKTIEQTLNIIS